MVTFLNDELHTAIALKQQLALIPTFNSVVPGGAWLDLIPEDQKFPAIRYHKYFGHDVSGATAQTSRIMSSFDWIVAGVTEGPGLTALLAIADAIDQILHRHTWNTADIAVMQCWRRETYSMTETGRSGVTFRHAGGVYRTIVQPL